ncbi:hypothetical protein [Sulfurovum sp.]|nr:hypothetical protein [Sulfurovum sp.]
MQNSITISIRAVRSKLKRTTDETEKAMLREELKRLKKVLPRKNSALN